MARTPGRRCVMVGRGSFAASGLVVLSLALAAPAADVSPDVPRRLVETGAPVKVWIFLDSKLPGASVAEQQAALAAARAALAPRVLERRALRGSAPLVDERDLPVAPA